MEIILKKLIIGTAQLGNKYGITNLDKKKTNKKTVKFLEFCFQNSLNSFDTASDYGSEKIIGDFIRNNYIKNINISTKIPSLKFVKNNKKLDFIKRSIDSSLNKLNLNNLDTVFFHDENDVKFFKLNELRIDSIFRSYKVKNLGFSIYSKNIFNILNRNKYINSLQVPANIINKDFHKIKSNKKIIGRSVFLQGILINPNLKTKNKILKNFNKKLFNIAKKKEIDLYSLCINYIIQKKEIDKLIIGFDNIGQLKKILKFKKNFSNLNNDIKSINSIVPKKYYKEIIDPRKW